MIRSVTNSRSCSSKTTTILARRLLLLSSGGIMNTNTNYYSANTNKSLSTMIRNNDNHHHHTGTAFPKITMIGNNNNKRYGWNNNAAATTTTASTSINNNSVRYGSSFSFSGPKKLDDILKTELVEGKSGAEIADIWYTYHEKTDNVHGIVLQGEDAKALNRAKDCPFFVQPIFREDGYFMMVSQYMQPNHFLLAYLEDYKMDPSAANPLLTFSMFDDYSNDKNITLVRCEILNKGITDEEGYKVVNSILDSYRNDSGYHQFVKPFNVRPQSFNLDDYISYQKESWNNNNNDKNDNP